MSRSTWMLVEVLVGFLGVSVLRAEDDLRATVEALKKQVDALQSVRAENENIRRELEGMKSAAAPMASSAVDVALDSKYGPNANVTTKTGKLTVGLITQIWYYGFEHDTRGLFDAPGLGVRDTNATQDNNTFRIRRTELKFTYDLDENFTCFMMIDPARETSTGFPNLPYNQGSTKRANVLSPEFAVANKDGLTSNTGPVSQVQNGAFPSGGAKLLQDTYFNWHGCIPNHDFTIGQFSVLLGEEGLRADYELDFVERSMLGFQCATRDMGAIIHGSWWNCDGGDGVDFHYQYYMPALPDGRFQYWIAVLDGAGSYFDPGNQHNRPDTNNEKDINARMLVRPLWDRCAGHLEVGVSFDGGTKGESGSQDPLNQPLNNLNRPTHWAARGNAWLSYKFGDWFARGLWARSEWGYIRDQEAPGSVLAIFGNGVNAASPFVQAQGRNMTRSGGYAALGYNFGDCSFNNCLPCWVKKFELAGRWEEFQNVEVANAVDSTKTDLLYSQAWTAGVNYYIKGQNAKIQANYIFMNGPKGPSATAHSFHNVRDDAFALNFQIAF